MKRTSGSSMQGDTSIVIEPSTNAMPVTRRWQERLLSPLWLFLLLALIIRVWLVIYTHGFADMDESLVGVQAQHILHGERPIYYYGQPYMGSLEPYLIALVFALFGSSSWTLRIEPVALSLVLVWLTWVLAGTLADGAKLSSEARRWFIYTACLLATLPPLYNLVSELRTWGGHIEIYLLMLLLLLAIFQLTRRWGEASGREMALRWGGIGLIIGVGLWIYPLIASAVLAALLWIGGYLAITSVPRLAERLAQLAEAKIPFALHRRNLLLASLTIPAMLLGFAPGIYWGAQHHWENVLYLFSPGSDGGNTPQFLAHYPNKLAVVKGTVGLYARCLVPHLYGGTLPTQPLTHSSVLSFRLLMGIGVAALVLTAALVLASLFWRRPLLLTMQRLATLPLLFAACTVFIFCFSSVVGHSLFEPCIRDGVGRYAAPVLLALPFFLATLVTAAAILIREHMSQPERGGTERQQSLRWPAFSVNLLVLPLLIYVLLIGTTYVKSDPRYIFQSFTCNRSPFDNSALIKYLQDQHIQRVWGTHALGDAIMLQTDSAIIVADPRVFTIHALNRLPADAEAVRQTDRASVLDMVAHTDKYPAIEKALDDLHVQYQVKRFPSQPGDVDILVLRPISRTLQPQEASSLGAWSFRC